MIKINARGQSTLEYILVIAAVLVAVIVAANLAIRRGVDRAMTDSSNVIRNATTKMSSSLGLGAGTTTPGPTTPGPDGGTAQ